MSDSLEKEGRKMCAQEITFYNIVKNKWVVHSFDTSSSDFSKIQEPL